jgi:hypothetical protein
MNRPEKGQSRATIYRKVKKAVDLQLQSCIPHSSASNTSSTISTCSAPLCGDDTVFLNDQTTGSDEDGDQNLVKNSLDQGEISEGEFDVDQGEISEGEFDVDQGEISEGEIDLDQVGESCKELILPERNSEIANANNFDLTCFLRDWSLSNNVTLSATSQLLKGLRVVHPDLPKDARTLLKTPRNVGVSEMGVGEYIFLGVTEMILKHAKDELDTVKPNLSLNFNVDGIPLFDASRTEFWPILCSIEGLESIDPFAVAIYCGVGKPPIKEFFNDFVLDLNSLLENGLTSNEIHYRVKVRAFICDAPAKAFMRCVKLYSGFYGCDRCTTRGIYFGRMTFPEVDAPLRTDESFALRLDSNFHHDGIVTPLAKLINTGLISTFPLDAMHLIYLGVTKRLLVYWIRGIKGVKLKVARMSVPYRNALSAYLIQSKEVWPTDFSRYPRGLPDVDRWKATELRQFLLYISVTALKGLLANDVYEHFMHLHCAVTILTSNKYADLNALAHEMLTVFVATASKFYGDEFIVYNIHSLIHVSSDALRLGQLDSFSAFKFENKLGILKREIRSRNKPLQQLCKRLGEKDNSKFEKKKTGTQISMHNVHETGPAAGLAGIQFRTLLLGPHFRLSTGQKDGVVILKDLRVMIIRNFVSLGKDDIFLIGSVYKKYSDFYTTPIESSALGVYFAENISSILTIERLACVKTKAVGFPYKNGMVVFPLLHNPVPSMS